MHDGTISLYDHVEDAIGHFYEIDSMARDSAATQTWSGGNDGGFWSEEMPADAI